MKNIEDGERYKYLGALKAEKFKNLEMKEKVGKEYFCRIKKTQKSKLNSSNVVKEVNSRAVAVIRYGAILIKWTIEENEKTSKKNVEHSTLK